ncbi:hypothetical protein [Sporosarcina globispora]|nr:hypothetical protein [Sporosarcina globispora]
MEPKHWTVIYRLAVVGILIYIATRLNVYCKIKVQNFAKKKCRVLHFIY